MGLQDEGVPDGDWIDFTCPFLSLTSLLDQWENERHIFLSPFLDNQIDLRWVPDLFHLEQTFARVWVNYRKVRGGDNQEE